MEQITVIAFYKFVALPDFETMRLPLRKLCHSFGLKGTILLAHEGINAMLAGSRESIDAILGHLRGDERLADLEHRESLHSEIPFRKMKVRFKREIVALGVEWVDPLKMAGEYVKPKDWNALISAPDVIVIDTRNAFEFEKGTFRGSVDPHTKRFRDFPKFVADELDPAKHKKVAMFCTGGIRCEKASSYLLEQGFENVYHLQGGILNYFKEIPKEESLFEGDCFIFDERIALDHDLNAE